MILDGIGLGLLILFFIQGYRKGIIVAVFSVAALLLGAVCALNLSAKFANWLMEQGTISNGWAQLVSYLVLFFGVVIIVRLLAKAIESSVKFVMLGWLNGIVGGVLYAGLSVVIWSSLLWILTNMHIISAEVQEHSFTYCYFEPVAPWVFGHIGKVMPFAKDVFGDLQHFFDGISKTIS